MVSNDPKSPTRLFGVNQFVKSLQRRSIHIPNWHSAISELESRCFMRIAYTTIFWEFAARIILLGGIYIFSRRMFLFCFLSPVFFVSSLKSTGIIPRIPSPPAHRDDPQSTATVDSNDTEHPELVSAREPPLILKSPQHTHKYLLIRDCVQYIRMCTGTKTHLCVSGRLACSFMSMNVLPCFCVQRHACMQNLCTSHRTMDCPCTPMPCFSTIPFGR